MSQILCAIRPNDVLSFTVPSQSCNHHWSVLVVSHDVDVTVHCGCRAGQHGWHCTHQTLTFNALERDGDIRWHQGRAIGHWVPLDFTPDGIKPAWLLS